MSSTKHRQPPATDLLSAILTATDCLIVVLDPEGRVVEFNRACETATGFDADQVRGRLVWDVLVPEEQVEDVKLVFGRLRAADYPNRHENHWLTVAGDRKLISWSNTAVVDDAGVVRYVVGTGIDVSTVKRMETDQSLLVTAIEQTAEAVIITDPDGTIRYVNPAFERITGYSAEESVGANPRLLKSGRQDDAFYRNLWETISAGRVWSGVFTNLRKDGTLFDEEATISPVHGEQGEVVAYVAVKRDVSVELELKKQLDRARKFEALGVLAGGIAHDFNNLLTTISGSAELLRLRLSESSGAKDELTTIHETVARGAALTRRLLSVAQLQAFNMVVIDLNKAILQELDVLRRVLPESIRIDFAPGSGRLAVRGDRGQLAQILLNLCVNARDAMPDGGVITVSTTEFTADAMLLAAHPDAGEGRYARLRVEDTGAGMDTDTSDRAFDPFFSTKSDAGGAGMGLATVYGIVRQHNGMIELESSPNAGSRFDLFFPLTSEALDETESKPERAAVGGSETILVVEDEARVREIQVGMLEALGYTVLQAENGRVALDILAREGDAIDLVLSDVTMPEMGGQELLDLARSRFPGLAFVFSSGYTDTEFLDRLGQGEIVHFIAKPFSMAKLAAIIREALAG